MASSNAGRILGQHNRCWPALRCGAPEHIFSCIHCANGLHPNKWCPVCKQLGIQINIELTKLQRDVIWTTLIILTRTSTTHQRWTILWIRAGGQAEFWPTSDSRLVKFVVRCPNPITTNFNHVYRKNLHKKQLAYTVSKCVENCIEHIYCPRKKEIYCLILFIINRC